MGNDAKQCWFSRCSSFSGATPDAAELVFLFLRTVFLFTEAVQKKEQEDKIARRSRIDHLFCEKSQ
jgi:hypothetical protein